MNIKSKIEDTAAFKGLPPYKQIIYRKAENKNKLQEQYILAKKQGYEEWKQEYKPTNAEDKIIQELLIIQ